MDDWNSERAQKPSRGGRVFDSSRNLIDETDTVTTQFSEDLGKLCKANGLMYVPCTLYCTIY